MRRNVLFLDNIGHEYVINEEEKAMTSTMTSVMTECDALQPFFDVIPSDPTAINCGQIKCRIR
jgi:hypothetical protein